MFYFDPTVFDETGHSVLLDHCCSALSPFSPTLMPPVPPSQTARAPLWHQWQGSILSLLSLHTLPWAELSHFLPTVQSLCLSSFIILDTPKVSKGRTRHQNRHHGLKLQNQTFVILLPEICFCFHFCQGHYYTQFPIPKASSSFSHCIPSVIKSHGWKFSFHLFPLLYCTPTSQCLPSPSSFLSLRR